jgi:Primosomal replication protein N
VLEMVLEHASEVIEAGVPRRVELTLEAVALGDLARMLEGTALGSLLHVQGFLAPTRKGSMRLKLHLQQAHRTGPDSGHALA